MKTYLSAFIVLLLVAVANYIGQEYGVSLMVPYYDVYLHLGGGAGIALMLAAMLRSYSAEYAATGKGRSLVLLGLLCVGLVWELFEAFFNITGEPLGSKAYYIDTVKDLIDDMIGGGVALWLTVLRGRG
jgi:hypothetical protein